MFDTNYLFYTHGSSVVPYFYDVHSVRDLERLTHFSEYCDQAPYSSQTAVKVPGSQVPRWSSPQAD